MEVRERLGFAGAGFGAHLLYTWVALYLLAYLYTGAGLSAGAVATLTVILGLCKVLDAVSDLLVGVLVDRTRSRWGTFRPYPILMSVPLFLLTSWLFTVPAGSSTRQITVIAVVYVLWSLAYTVGDVPYWSLTTVITTSEDSRARLVGWARTAALIGLACATLGGAPLAVALSNGADGQATGTGWTRATLLVAAVSMALFTLASLTTREKVPFQAEPMSFAVSARTFARNRPLLLLLASGVLSFGQLLAQVGGAVLAAVVFGDIRAFTILGGALIVAMALSALAAPRILRRTTRRRFMIVNYLGVATTNVTLFAIGWHSLTWTAVLMFAGGLFFGANTVVQIVMVGDTADYIEATTGSRADGISFAGLTFITKLSSALATMLFGVTTAWVGYGPQAPVTEAMRGGIWLVFTLGCALSCLLAIIPLRWYSLPEAELPALLAQRRAERGVTIG